MTPVVSILILTFNRMHMSSEYIPAIIDSIGPISHEVLIWDNGSTDGSYDWLYTYSQADCRITKIFGHHKNIGMEAINNLAEEATGKYILKVDDDVIVPRKFAQRIVGAYEKVNEPKLLFLGWDIPWGGGPRAGGNTFATRSGMKQYSRDLGKVVALPGRERVLINFNPRMWMINGVCRLSPRKTFLEIGGHPKGIVYGVDKHISKRASKHGYWIGFYNTPDLVDHRGLGETEAYRKMKDRELARVGSPRHV